MEKNYFILPAGCRIDNPVDKNSSLLAMDAIRCEVTKHLGQKVILHQSNKKVMIPKIVEIKGVYAHFVKLSYLCYDEYGEFKQNLTECISWKDLFCGIEALEFLDSDI